MESHHSKIKKWIEQNFLIKLLGKKEKIMNSYDLQTLVNLGSIIQWVAIILIFLGVLLQVSKFVIDRRIGDMRDQLAGSRTAKYEKAITALKARIIEQDELLEKTRTKIIPKSLIPKMKAELSKYKEASVRITCVKDDKGALYFSEQLKSIFKSAGWRVKGVYKDSFSLPPKRIVIVLNDKEQKSKANYVFSVLKSLGLKGIGKLNQNQKEDLGIMVGSKE
jgi:hypothetical protein